MTCSKCSKQFEEPMFRADRKPGLNPYEAAIAQGDDGFTEPKPCCPHCREYLSEEDTKGRFIILGD